MTPLNGIRVLEFGSYLAGPYAGALLASLGADVVKVEIAGSGDPFRRGVGTADVFFAQMNAGKRSLAVDLKSESGVSLIKQLVPNFDVALENMRPGKMAALGLGAEVLRSLHPPLIYAAVSGFGDGGPWRDRAAYDTIGLSMSGFLSIMSDEDDVQLAGTCIGDLAGALVTAMGVLAGLVGRNQNPDHTGVDIQTSLLEAMSTITIDAMTHLFDTGGLPTRETRHPVAQSFCPRTADGGALALHLSGSEKFWLALTRAIDRPELAEDPRFASYGDRRRNYGELRPIVEAEFLRLDRDEWERRLTEADVPYAPVLTATDQLHHPQANWLDLYEPKRNGLRLLRAPWRFGGQRPPRSGRVPEIGEHSREVASEVLHERDVEQLFAEGVLMEPERSDP